MFRRSIFAQIKSVSRDRIDQPIIDMIINQDSRLWYKTFVRVPPSKYFFLVPPWNKLKNRSWRQADISIHLCNTFLIERRRLPSGRFNVIRIKEFWNTESVLTLRSSYSGEDFWVYLYRCYRSVTHSTIPNYRSISSINFEIGVRRFNYNRLAASLLWFLIRIYWNFVVQSSLYISLYIEYVREKTFKLCNWNRIRGLKLLKILIGFESWMPR